MGRQRIVYRVLALVWFFIQLFISANGKTAKLKLITTGAHETSNADGKSCPYGKSFNQKDAFYECACLSGVWAIYNDPDACSTPLIIAGGRRAVKCVKLNKQVAAVHLISSAESHKDTLTVFDKDMKKVEAKLESMQDSYQLTAKTPYTFITVGSTSWGVDPAGPCFTPTATTTTKQQYCYFTYTPNASVSLHTRCGQGSINIAPAHCVPFASSSTTDCYSIRNDAQITYEPSTSYNENITPPVKSRHIREANDSAVNENDENSSINRTDKITVIDRQLFNYFTLTAQDILNLTDQQHSKSTVKTSPTFRLLELTKKILQKACPDSYVKNEHFDMAVGTFTTLQTKTFKFQDTFTDYQAAQRIEDSLKLCLAKIEPYPFVNASFMAENGTCIQPKLGSFWAFGELAELDITEDLDSREREPIIETVWKIFVHAHAACFTYFSDFYNDHHRFTSVFIPLFLNEIHDIWTSVSSVTGNLYAGLLGDAVNLMDSVAYCAEYSKLDTEYPWNLPRPSSSGTSSDSGNGTAPGAGSDASVNLPDPAPAPAPDPDPPPTDPGAVPPPPPPPAPVAPAPPTAPKDRRRKRSASLRSTAETDNGICWKTAFGNECKT